MRSAAEYCADNTRRGGHVGDRYTGVSFEDLAPAPRARADVVAKGTASCPAHDAPRCLKAGPNGADSSFPALSEYRRHDLPAWRVLPEFQSFAAENMFCIGARGRPSRPEHGRSCRRHRGPSGFPGPRLSDRTYGPEFNDVVLHCPAERNARPTSRALGGRQHRVRRPRPGFVRHHFHSKAMLSQLIKP